MASPRRRCSRRSRVCKGIDLSTCTAITWRRWVGTNSQPRCEGLEDLDYLRAREEVGFDASEPLWLRMRVVAVTRTYARLLMEDREAATTRCAEGTGARLAVGTRCARRPR